MTYDLHKKAAALVSDADGELVGRTRLQKMAYLLQLAGFSDDFPFEYRHYGPYSQELADAMKIAVGLRLVEEEERVTDWGARYSIYRNSSRVVSSDENRILFLRTARDIDPIDLELAATAAYLFREENSDDPWEETRRRKPEKAVRRLKRAKQAYRKLMSLTAPEELPAIV